MTNSDLITEARKWVAEDKMATFPPDAPLNEEADLIQRLADALEKAMGEQLRDGLFTVPLVPDTTHRHQDEADRLRNAAGLIEKASYLLNAAEGGIHLEKQARWLRQNAQEVEKYL